MKIRTVAALAVCALASTFAAGCVPIIAGALVYDNVADNEAQQKFADNLNTRNIEREKAGLPKLDWCSEAYKAKRNWAEADKFCAARIKRYEAGDQAALAINS